ncbi:MAG: hypothetical protein JWM41_4437, partial [Gemmatimonadetes bacterium]|nr:hypothetical protein [Gemmatimonadota bacterium]
MANNPVRMRAEPAQRLMQNPAPDHNQIRDMPPRLFAHTVGDVPHR